MKNKILILIILAVSQSFLGCNDWLDVSPVTDIDLEDQIKSADGFNEMLNGVYISLSDESLYGHHLMYGALAQAAQNHVESSDLPITNFDYVSTNPKSIIKNVWNNLYNAIANNNIILDNIDDNADLFLPDDYKLVKAEAIALRAFIHFDALRLFGDVYVDGTSEDPQIPYVTKYERLRFPHLPIADVYAKILEDLDAAEAILEEVDPIKGSYEGILFSADERKYHMNYYAVLALKARVYITMKDNVNALLYAEKVINEYEWSWVSPDRLNGSDDEKDLLFMDELICALNVSKLNTYYNRYFGENSTQYHAATTSDNYADLVFEKTIAPVRWWQSPTPGPGGNDWRYLHLMKIGGFGHRSISIKYDQDVPIQKYFSDEGWVTLIQHRTVPLIRITELMLIAAEASLETDLDKAIQYVNSIKEKREVELTDISGSVEDVLDAIVKELRKETYLEGQIFYMYKRLQLTSIPTMGTKYFRDVTPENFIFPLPDNELEFGNIQE
ncbi:MULTISPECIES: RagB/SusD family nutrient uptake outer membrane protein [unclassified Saccharicrinis]|uniref:RagB/SusD family nutrient uptake outer membrane protein n=1 Tax=unclassified Saccharicrinis TaxID=2646859 RepID=UPI003D34F945